MWILKNEIEGFLKIIRSNKMFVKLRWHNHGLLPHRHDSISRWVSSIPTAIIFTRTILVFAIQVLGSEIKAASPHVVFHSLCSQSLKNNENFVSHSSASIYPSPTCCWGNIFGTNCSWGGTGGNCCHKGSYFGLNSFTKQNQSQEWKKLHQL